MHGIWTPGGLPEWEQQDLRTERVLLIAARPADHRRAADLAEIHRLIDAAGGSVVADLIQARTPDAHTYLGEGRLGHLGRMCIDHGIARVIALDALSPTQLRELERHAMRPVIDRTQLILDIFARRARSHAGRVQVELAQLRYQLPRMRGGWDHLERTGGGIGTRGPGETQLETDRRTVRTRIGALERRLGDLERTRAVQRHARARAGLPRIVVVGYTRAGKTSLLDALADRAGEIGEGVFTTLDPVTRRVCLDGRRYLVSDTVGFVRDLPHALIQGFRSTLEEAREADLLLVLADGAEPPRERLAQLRAVHETLAVIGANRRRRLVVFNKIDRLDDQGRAALVRAHPTAHLLSVHSGEGMHDLRARIEQALGVRRQPVSLLFPHTEARALHQLYEITRPMARRDAAEGVLVVCRLPAAARSVFARFRVAAPTGIILPT